MGDENGAPNGRSDRSPACQSCGCHALHVAPKMVAFQGGRPQEPRQAASSVDAEAAAAAAGGSSGSTAGLSTAAWQQNSA